MNALEALAREIFAMQFPVDVDGEPRQGRRIWDEVDLDNDPSDAWRPRVGARATAAHLVSHGWSNTGIGHAAAELAARVDCGTLAELFAALDPEVVAAVCDAAHQSLVERADV